MSKTRARPPFRVQVMVGADLEYFRDVVLGVRRYGFSTGRLAFADRWLEHEAGGELRELVRRDGVRGIVAALHSVEEERRLLRSGVPVVNVSNGFLSRRVPLVSQDDMAVGRLAAGHLQACGCRAFGFWGQEAGRYSTERLRGFEAGLGRGTRLAVEVAGYAADAALYARMREWLARQPRPLGVFAVLDTYALLLMRAARELGWRVPEDVALLGAGDEDFWVEFESVPLSSVRLPARRIGHAAGELLDRMITRGSRTARSVRLGGAEIVARRSTDVIYAEDEAVARAVRFIREQATGNPYVGDVAKAAGVSRSALQMRFRAALGRTVLEEIQRVRVGRAQALLAGSEMKLSEVAERCGFPNSQRFSVVFREVAAVTPSEYRRQFRER